MDPKARITLAEELHARIVATAGFAIEQRMRTISRMTEMVALNHAELRIAIRALADPRLASNIARVRNEDSHDARDDLFEVARRLDSYLSSAVSRVERTRLMSTDLKELDTTLAGDCDVQLEALRRRPVYRLMEYLRDHSPHVSFHALQYEVTFKPPDGQPVTGGRVPAVGAVSVYIVKPPLKAQRSRRQKDKDSPLASYPERLDIESLTREFNEAADVFIGWYVDRLQELLELHGDEWDRLRDELRTALSG